MPSEATADQVNKNEKAYKSRYEDRPYVFPILGGME
jgi:hypothetical protein